MMKIMGIEYGIEGYLFLFLLMIHFHYYYHYVYEHDLFHHHYMISVMELQPPLNYEVCHQHIDLAKTLTSVTCHMDD